MKLTFYVITLSIAPRSFVSLSFPCLRIARNLTALETSNLVER